MFCPKSNKKSRLSVARGNRLEGPYGLESNKAVVLFTAAHKRSYAAEDPILEMKGTSPFPVHRNPHGPRTLPPPLRRPTSYLIHIII